MQKQASTEHWLPRQLTLKLLVQDGGLRDENDKRVLIQGQGFSRAYFNNRIWFFFFICCPVTQV